MDALFDMAVPGLEKGEIYRQTERTVTLVMNSPDLSEKLAGTCALALRLALEADNVNTSEKAYARTKVYEALNRTLDSITAALTAAQSDTSTLQAVLRVITQDDAEDPGADL